MKQIVIADTTLCREDAGFGFKEKIEIARLLNRLNADVIELPAVKNSKTDILLVRTISSLIKDSILSVEAGANAESIELAAAALNSAAKPRIRIALSLSPVGMEYTFHKKPAKMLEWVSEAVQAAKQKCADVEFCALDATRAEADFLSAAMEAAVAAGANVLSVCDDAGRLLPDDFAGFAGRVAASAGIPVGVSCSNRSGLAAADAVLAAKCEQVTCVKTSVGGDRVPLEAFAGMIQNCGADYGLGTRIKYTELHRIVKQLRWIAENAGNEKPGLTASGHAEGADGAERAVCLDAQDRKEDVIAAAAKLGYDLSEEDCDKVYGEFLRVASKKNVGARELDAIIASTALQVPPAYTLKTYVINNGNIISSSAQITLVRDGKDLSGVCMGDGPIDAAFLALEQIIGHHYELDDFQIQSVTEGTEAMGSALVRLRSNGKLYSGSGISTDIIGASIRAYISAVNKIVYEEAAQ